ncbi:unknown protein [Desulfotalea psychrophila LSv54]|uniref:Uncharacterized protein n=1 Tax=Desulfotalea psychrophila (strain LSv54 / DSM 12343) TaxID=177439 RepID=Q6AKF1_DESPS|nr:unknown protein [Desulfotalea psychrophila LSv54]
MGRQAMGDSSGRVRLATPNPPSIKEISILEELTRRALTS